MADENKKSPNGWGSDEDDDDYGFIDDADEDDEDSAWGNGSPFKKKESVTDSNENEESDNGHTESSVPAQEVKTSENSAAPVPPVNPPYNQGYVIQKQKSNPLFIIVIIILVLIIGVLCTAIFMVNKNKKTNGSEKSGNSSYDEISEITSKNTENDNTETEIPDITTAATTEIITESTTEKSEVLIVQDNEKVYAALDQTLNNFYVEGGEFRNTEYALIDVNNDGISELFIRYESLAGYSIKMFVYDNSIFNDINIRFNDIKISFSEKMIQDIGYEGATCYTFYRLTDSNQLDFITELKYYAQQYYWDGTIIKDYEYNNALASFDKFEWSIPEFIPFTPRNTNYIQNELSSSNPYADIKQEILHSVDNEDYRGKNSHIENAPSDMVFYSTGNRSSLNISNPIVYEGPGTNYSQIPTYQDRFDIVGENSSWYYIQWYEGAGRFAHPCYGYINKDAVNKNTSEYTDKSNLIATGKVITEKDDLNMRESNSADSKIIKTIPKGHYVGIISEYGDWLYVKYYADTNSPIYYGFVSKQFIEITERY